MTGRRRPADDESFEAFHRPARPGRAPPRGTRRPSAPRRRRPRDRAEGAHEEARRGLAGLAEQDERDDLAEEMSQLLWNSPWCSVHAPASTLTKSGRLPPVTAPLSPLPVCNGGRSPVHTLCVPPEYALYKLSWLESAGPDPEVMGSTPSAVLTAHDTSSPKWSPHGASTDRPSARLPEQLRGAGPTVLARQTVVEALSSPSTARYPGLETPALRVTLRRPRRRHTCRPGRGRGRVRPCVTTTTSGSDRYDLTAPLARFRPRPASTSALPLPGRSLGAGKSAPAASGSSPSATS